MVAPARWCSRWFSPNLTITRFPLDWERHTSRPCPWRGVAGVVGRRCPDGYCLEVLELLSCRGSKRCSCTCYRCSNAWPGEIPNILFERSEFLIDTSQKKSLHACRVHVCTRAIIFVLVCRIMYHIRTYLISARLPRYVHPTLRTTSVTLVVCIEKIKGCRV